MRSMDEAAIIAPLPAASGVSRRTSHSIQGSEGPCVTRDGRVLMVGPNEGRVIEVLKDGSLSILCKTGGIPAGLAVDKTGAIWIADMKLGILRLSLEGELHREVEYFEGNAIRGCNDLTFDSQGNLYFTAPGDSSAENPCGEVFCRLVDGEIRRLAQGFAFCNGIAVDASDRLLLIAETWTKKIIAFDLPEPGVTSDERTWAILPGDHFGGPDGIDFDLEGNLIATNWGAGTLDVFSRKGRLTRRIALPFSKPSNVHFEGPRSASLLVTEHDTHSLWSFDYGIPGQVQLAWM